MPSFTWSCLACGNSNPPSVAACARCNCPASATVKQIEAAQQSAPEDPGVQAKLEEAQAQDRAGLYILLTVLSCGAAWLGAEFIFKFESYALPLAGLLLLAVAWLAWRVRNDG